MDKLVHFEIPTDDSERAQKFYSSVFGWHTMPFPQMKYVIVHTGPTDDSTSMVKDKGFINGGMFKRNTERSNPILIIDVQSIDESIQKIEAAGGKRVGEKLPIENMGSVWYFKDCEGNLLGIWETGKK